MRALRTFLGLVLVIVGLPMVLLVVDAAGAPTSAAAPVRSVGHAVLVPDAGILVERDRAPWLPARTRLTVRSASEPLFVGLAPLDQARRYLEDVPHTELVAGRLIDVDGGSTPSAANLPLWSASGSPDAGALTLQWSPSPGLALVVMRADGGPGVEATFATGPAWPAQAMWLLLFGGTAALLGGVVLLFWPERRREVVLVVEAHRMVDFADRIADRLGGSRHHDVTGELLAVEQRESYVSTAT